MAIERTLTIIKPDAVSAGNSGNIISHLVNNGFRIVAIKRLTLSASQAEGFYHVHRQRPFFGGLVKFMSEGPIIPIVLEGDDAIKKLRDVMGATNPANAAEGTIRKQYATDIERNAIHGSDAPDTARFEIGYFFAGYELV